ncbi:unnamed protein product [Porites lobata]|uniref:Uncharacterized protein n=1 Tax=Porites lobata TaxID=104759 RepID=A0ABN8NC70_9CNID|nr:unnamed protein product [Porites lobata]
MAKSIRSKRKRKLRAERRQKLKPKVKAKLEEVLGINDKKMIVEAEESRGGTVDETQEEIPQASQETSNNEEGTEDVEMPEDGPQKKLGKKALQKLNKQRKLKRLKHKKQKNKKLFKW